MMNPEYLRLGKLFIEAKSLTDSLDWAIDDSYRGGRPSKRVKRLQAMVYSAYARQRRRQAAWNRCPKNNRQDLLVGSKP